MMTLIDTAQRALFIPAERSEAVVYSDIPGHVCASVPQLPKALCSSPEVVNRIRMLAEREVVNTQPPATTPNLTSPTNLKDLLLAGEWGKALIGFVPSDVRTPIKITEETVNSIFEWEESIDVEVKNSYVQAVETLLQLPSGIGLIRDIIIVYHCLPDLPILKFVRDEDDNTHGITTLQYPDSCDLNLEWNADEGRHVGSDRVLVVSNSEGLDFVRMDVPPAVVLAHELGHYLYYLIACKNVMEGEISCVDVVSKVIAAPNPVAKVHYRKKMSSMFGKSRLVKKFYAQEEYKAVIRDIAIHSPPTPAEQAFMTLWGEESYLELVNILPTAKMLGNGGSNYSDGVVMGEAYRNAAMRDQIRFYDATGAAVDINDAGLTPESFVRFGHCDAERFFTKFNALVDDAGKIEFKGLVQQLLNKITVLTAVDPAAAAASPPPAASGASSSSSSSSAAVQSPVPRPLSPANLPKLVPLLPPVAKPPALPPRKK
jgi:hypothetical protein